MGALFLPGLLVSAWIWLVAAPAERRAQDEALHLARVLAQPAALALDDARGLLRAITRSRRLAGERAACDAYLAEVLAANPALLNLVKVDRNGGVACSGRPAGTNISFAGESFFRRALATRSFLVSGVRVGKISRRAQLTLALPIIDRGGGAVLSVVQAGIDLDWFAKQFEGLTVPTGGSLTAIDRDGKIIARHSAAGGPVGEPFDDLAAARAVAGEKGRIEDPDGVPRLFGAVPIGPERDGLAVVVALPRPRAASVVPALIWASFAASALLGALAWSRGQRRVADPSTRRRFWLAAAGVALLAGTGMVAALQLRRAGGERDAWVAHTREVIGTLQEIAASVAEVEASQRGFLLGAEDSRLGPSVTAGGRLARSLPELARLVRDSPAQGARARALQAKVAVELNAMRRTAELARAGALPAARAVADADAGRPGPREVRALVGAMMAEERGLLVQRQHAAAESERQAILAAGTAAAIALAAFLGAARLGFAERRRRAASDAGLRDSEALFHGVFDHATDAITIHRVVPGIGLRLEASNAAAERAHAPAPGTAAQDVPPGGSEAPGATFLPEADPDRLAAQGPVRFEIATEGADATRHWEVVQVPVRDPATGAVVRVLRAARDITERKQAELALTAARDEAVRANRAKSEFLASMSHEMRTPLTAVIGMADLLAGRPLEPEVEGYVEAIRRSGRQLLAIVNDVLDFMRLGAGRLGLHEEDFALDAVLEEVGSTLRPLATEKGLALEIEAPRDPPPLRGDPTRLRQILFNLVGNAVKFTARGHVRVHCDLVDGQGGGIGLRAEVRDTGIGIAADQLPRLFQPFTQVDGSASRGFGGAGLGLAISKQLVELMGGRVGCESTPAAGSRFWFEVTLQRAQAKVARTGKVAWAHVPPLRLLLAEDAPLNRQLLTDMLGRQGHRVTCADNGAEFLDRAGEQRFDLLLVDIQMPVLDGERAVRRLRRGDGPNQATPALALTANVMEDDRQRYLEAGFDAVLHKPIAWDRLFAEMARLAARDGPAPERAEPVVPPPAAEGTEPGSAVDWAFVAAAFDGLPVADAAGFLERALADARVGLDGLRDPALSTDARCRLAHRLKGTTRSFGLVGLGDAAEAVERAVKGGSDTGPALDGYVAALEETAALLAEKWPA